MATQILRTLDRWRFETPLALLFAGAAGFAVMAMPHDLFAQLPVAGSLGRPAQGGLAVLAALICGLLGYFAMRRPTRRAAVVDADEDIDLFQEPAAAVAAAPAPLGVAAVRLRRADRHPDAPAREPIRASRDLGEPFMDVGTLTPVPMPGELVEHGAIEHEAAEVVPDETDPAEPAPMDAAPVAVESPEADPVEVESIATETAETEPTEAEITEPAPTEIAQPVEDAVAQHDEPPIVVPVAVEAVEPAAERPPMFRPLPSHAPAEAPAAAPIAATPATAVPAAAARFPFTTVERPEDASLAAMIDRLSNGMKGRGDGGLRALGPARDRGPALRDALDELNRLAVRRG